MAVCLFDEATLLTLHGIVANEMQLTALSLGLKLHDAQAILPVR